MLSSVGDRNISVIVSRHTLLYYWIKTKKAPVLYYSKIVNRETWCVVREAWGARREPSLYSFARCFVTRRRGSWTIAMGITKTSDRRRRARPPLCGRLAVSAHVS